MVHRILLVEAPQIWRTKDHTPPLGLGYLAAAARHALPNADVAILDATAEGRTVEQTVAEIGARRPDLIGLTGNSHNRFNVIDICRAVKAQCPATRIVLGGPHFSYTAEDALSQIAAADFVVRGEGEQTFAELLQALAAEDEGALAAIPGLCFRRGGERVLNPDREPMHSIDLMPAWDLFRHELYHARLEGTGSGRAVGVVSTRGCPFRCVFCANRNALNRRSRFRSPSHFVSEVELLKETYGYNEFDIWDDTFTLKRAHAEAVCRELLRRKVSIRWYALIRANTTDTALLELMREAGCCSVGLGVESGSPTVLQSIRKEIDVDAVRRVTHAAVRLGLRVKAFFMHSLPGETADDLRRTRELMYDLRSYSRRVRSIWAMTVIYPGTELEQIAGRSGMLPPGFSWNEREPRGAGLHRGNGCVPYFSGAELSPDEIKRYAKSYRPRLPRRLGRRLTRLLMRLPSCRRLVR